ncbi:MAG: ubiquinone/menaquinone biosynthesis methyltransferase [Planctomycetota bacterium]|nr:MAG: ubiquinone/menaquinone biosynthesis methyltransferase [Planctomycetota bacterium]
MSNKTHDICWDRRRLSSPHTQHDKGRRVQKMFDAIAPTYSLINSLASMGRDGYWRREMARLAEVKPDDVLLDIACGTGDVAWTFASSAVHPARIVGLDFSLPMLQGAVGRQMNGSEFYQADALELPIADNSVSIVSCAFGIRNFQDLEAGLGQMYRVLRSGGRAVILEFCVPRRPVFRRLYLAYFNRLMPIAATMISRDRTGAYRYLPHSVLSFQGPKKVTSLLKAAGFSHVSVHRLTWGIVAIYVARKT